jgi:hypothetical protein
MPHIEKIGDSYIIVSNRDTAKKFRKFKGGPRTNFMIRYTESQYKYVGGKKIKYTYPVLSMNNIHLRCPQELIGKRVILKVEVMEDANRIKKDRHKVGSKRGV